MKTTNIGQCTLIQGDCLEVLPQLIQEGTTVDLVLTDPPYGTTNNSKDIIIPFNEMWPCIKGIRKNNAPTLLFAQGLYYVDLVSSNRKEFKYDFVWDKILTSGFLNANRMPLRRHEQIAVFYKKLPTYHPQFTEGKPLHSKGTNYLSKKYKNQNYGEFKQTDDNRKGCTQKHPTSIITYQKPHSSIAKHRTEKSIDMLEYLIKTYTNEGDIVLDFTAGSFTTGIACQNTNRKFIGIELDEHYYNIGVQRMKENQERFDMLNTSC